MKQRNPWLELLRPPNLFTVPGDPVAGAIVAWIAMGGRAMVDWWQLALAAGASLLLYAGGLVQNDYYDQEQDRVERPHRPIPSGRVRAGTAMTVAMLMMVAGVAAAWLAAPPSGVMAAVALGIITAYNAGGKRVAVIGPLLMGACRGLSLLIGAALLGADGLVAPGPIVVAAGLTLYIAAVTAVASRETTTRVGWRRHLPSAAMLPWAAMTVAGTMFLPLADWQTLPSFVLLVMACGYVFACSRGLAGEVQPAHVQQTVGRLIRVLLLVQASVAALAGPVGWGIAAVLLAFWPISSYAGRRFYAS